MFSYYGTKKRLAQLYPAPLHATIIEPFAGAAGYSLLYPAKNVYLYDTNPKVCAIWRYLIGARRSDILALPDMGEGDKVTTLDLPDAVKWLIGFCINPGSSVPKVTASHRTAWNRYKLHIADQVEKVKHWRVYEQSYEKAPNIEATWHIDPPYQIAGKYYFGYAKMDYARLGLWCKTRLGQVMVCENEGATYLPFRRLTRHRGSINTKTEVVWYNTLGPTEMKNE
jgi:hypothetical protein